LAHYFINLVASIYCNFKILTAEKHFAMSQYTSIGKSTKPRKIRFFPSTFRLLNKNSGESKVNLNPYSKLQEDSIQQNVRLSTSTVDENDALTASFSTEAADNSRSVEEPVVKENNENMGNENCTDSICSSGAATTIHRNTYMNDMDTFAVSFDDSQPDENVTIEFTNISLRNNQVVMGEKDSLSVEATNKKPNETSESFMKAFNKKPSETSNTIMVITANREGIHGDGSAAIDCDEIDEAHDEDEDFYEYRNYHSPLEFLRDLIDDDIVRIDQIIDDLYTDIENCLEDVDIICGNLCTKLDRPVVQKRQTTMKSKRNHRSCMITMRNEIDELTIACKSYESTKEMSRPVIWIPVPSPHKHLNPNAPIVWTKRIDDVKLD
jgi:hypothetical protein